MRRWRGARSSRIAGTDNDRPLAVTARGSRIWALPSAHSRRRLWLPVTTAIVVLLVAASADASPTTRQQAGTSAPSVAASAPAKGRIAAIAEEAMAQYHLKALIVRVTTDGRNTYTGALGESMTGVPATVDMHVRNGFVAYSYLTTMLLEFVDQGRINLKDKLSKYLPNLPEANDVTIKMLANSTSGYADYVYQPAVLNAVERYPFQQWSTAELIKIGTSAPLQFPPGTNWAYSHTNYAILGEVLSKVGGKPLAALMNQYIFERMDLKHTQASDTPQIPEPVLHTFSSERRQELGVAAGTPFYEDSTFWNPSWSAPAGAVQTTDIADLTTSIRAIGSGELLSPQSHRAQVAPNLVGFGHPAPGCSACQENTAQRSFGLGVILVGPWITGNKFYAGSGAAVGYLPSHKLAIAVITTYQPDAFNSQGEVTDVGPAILSSLAKTLAPASPIPA